MKRIIKIMMMTMVLTIAVTGVMNAQRGMRGQMADTAWKGKTGDYAMRHRNIPPDSMMISMREHRGQMGMRGGMRQAPVHRPYHGYADRPYMAWGPGPGFGEGYGPGRFGRPGYAPQPPLMRRLESIPNLTEKQKKDIADLRQKHQEQMQKFREENFTKAKELRDAHQKKLMDLLTDEQKKYLEGGTQTPPPVKK